MTKSTYTLSTDVVLADSKDGVATITLNRPEARNALSNAMLKGLFESLDALEADPEVKVIILTGAGKGFCSGGDLKSMAQGEDMFGGNAFDLRNKYIQGIQTNTKRFARCTKPLIAAVNGHAIGAGLGLALSCDIRVMSDQAKVGLAFPQIGLIAGDGSAYLLQRAIGVAKASELVITGRIIEAQEALNLGVTHYLTPTENVLSKAQEIAHQLSSLPPHAVQLGKSLFYRSAETNLDGALALASAYQAVAHDHPDHQKAVKNMLEKISSSS